MGHVFERQAKESAKAFAAFSVYLGMGPDRSLEAVGQKCGKSSRLIQRWSSKWRWADRVRAHAERIAAVEQEQMEELARKRAAERLKRKEAIEEEGWAVSEECLAGAREALKRFYEKGKGATLGDIARMYAEGIRLGRLSVGLACDKTESAVETDVAVRLELNAALNKVYGDAVDVEMTLPEGESALPEPRANRGPVDGEARGGLPIPAATSPTTP